MSKAARTTTTDRTPRGSLAPFSAQSLIDPASLLAGIIERADILGPTPGGGAFLLVEAPAALVDHLAEVGAADEDAEPETTEDEDDAEDDARGPAYAPDRRAPWPPSRDELAAAVAAGESNNAIGKRYGRHDSAVASLLRRYGLPSAKEAGTLRRSCPGYKPGGVADAGAWDAARKAPRPRGRVVVPLEPPPGVDLTWPPSPEAMAALAALGIGDRRAARLFGKSAVAYRDQRRRHAGRGIAVALDADSPAVDPAEYGYDPRFRWPEGARFLDDLRAGRPLARLSIPRPITHVPTGTTMALCTEAR